MKSPQTTARQGRRGSGCAGAQALSCRHGAAALLLGVCFLWGVNAEARTIVLSDTDCTAMACLSADAPRQSWASYEPVAGIFASIYVDLSVNRSFLIAFPLDKVPKGQRITKAELIVSANYLWGQKPRLFVWRVLPAWGPGVCYEDRMVVGDKPVPWGAPGGKANAADRAATATTVMAVDAAGPVTMNVTQDVELWYTGAAANHGWMLTIEDADSNLRLDSPQWSPGNWKLRITYEPQ